MPGWRKAQTAREPQRTGRSSSLLVGVGTSRVSAFGRVHCIASHRALDYPGFEGSCFSSTICRYVHFGVASTNAAMGPQDWPKRGTCVFAFPRSSRRAGRPWSGCSTLPGSVVLWPRFPSPGFPGYDLNELSWEKIQEKEEIRSLPVPSTAYSTRYFP